MLILTAELIIFAVQVALQETVKPSAYCMINYDGLNEFYLGAFSALKLLSHICLIISIILSCILHAECYHG